MDDRTCKQCRHFVPYGTQQKGWCTRYPPTPVYISYSETVDTRWPEVGGTEGCGEFRPEDKPMSAQERIAAKRNKS